MVATLHTLVDGLGFPEGPRWRGDTLWCSDIFGHAVLRIGADGDTHTVAVVHTQPSGLGWLPDGRLPSRPSLGSWVAPLFYAGGCNPPRYGSVVSLLV